MKHNLKIYLYGPLRELLSKDSVIMKIETPITIEKVLDDFYELYGIKQYSGLIRVIINNKFVDKKSTIDSETKSISLIPPVGGG